MERPIRPSATDCSEARRPNKPVLVAVAREVALHWRKRWIETEEAGQRPWKKRILAVAGVVMRLLILAAAALLLWYLGVSHSAFVFFRAAPRP